MIVPLVTIKAFRDLAMYDLVLDMVTEQHGEEIFQIYRLMYFDGSNRCTSLLDGSITLEAVSQLEVSLFCPKTMSLARLSHLYLSTALAHINTEFYLMTILILVQFQPLKYCSKSPA